MAEEIDALREDVRETLFAIFRSVLQLPPDADVTAIRQAEVERWDSLGHVSLITAVESEFDIDVGVADAMDLTSFRAVAGYIQETLNEQGR